MTSPTTLALVLLLAAGPAAAPHDRTAAAEPASSGFTLRLAIPTIVSNDAFMWVVPFRLFNPGGMGLYTDSLVCEVDSQDPNVPERARHTVTPAFNASRLVGTVSGGDSARFEFQLPATAERGRMTIRYVGHRSNGEQLHAALQAPIEPGEAAKGIASEFVTLGTGRVEFVRMIADSATLGPTVLLVPGDDLGARTTFRQAQTILARGINVVAVSLPGRGLSSPGGDARANLAAVTAVLERMRGLPGVDSARIAIWGTQSAAALAAGAAAERSGVRALVCESGCYDSKACGASGSIAGRPRVATLILHGEKDDIAPLAQAQAFEAALKAAGAEASTKVIPALGHNLQGVSLRPALEFLTVQLR